MNASETDCVSSWEHYFQTKCHSDQIKLPHTLYFIGTFCGYHGSTEGAHKIVTMNWR